MSDLMNLKEAIVNGKLEDQGTAWQQKIADNKVLQIKHRASGCV